MKEDIAAQRRYLQHLYELKDNVVNVNEPHHKFIKEIMGVFLEEDD